jgi:hypothetical protein
MTPSDHPSSHAGWLASIGAGALSLLLSLLRRKPSEEKEDEFAAAALRGGERAKLLGRLAELEGYRERAEERERRFEAEQARIGECLVSQEARAQRCEAGIDRIARLITEGREDWQRELDKAVRRLAQEIADKCS